MSPDTIPYDSSKSKAAKISKPPNQPSIIRGIGYAARFSIIGFLIPYLLGLAWAFGNYYLGTKLEFDLTLDLQRIPIYYLGAAIACAIVFGFAAILNFTPSARLGIVRSLLYVGAATIVCLIISGLATLVFGLEQRTYGLNPWLWLQVLFAVIPLSSYVILHTCVRCTDGPA